MKDFPEPLDLKKVRVYPLAERESLSKLEELIIEPAAKPKACDEQIVQTIAGCAGTIAEARRREASVMLLYGAHLIKNGAMKLVNQLLEIGWIRHRATNGAGTIHE